MGPCSDDRRAMLGLLAFILFTYVSGQQLFLGDDCQLNYGSTGVCRRAADCSSVQGSIASGNIPTICAYEKQRPIVCCPLSAPPPRPTPRPPPRTTRRPTPTRATPTPSQPGRFAGKSWDKCLEYAMAVNQTVKSPVLTHDSDLETEESQCAVVAQGLIIAGERCAPKEFPHMAALGFGEKTRIAWLCGGSLISPRFVLTAAHCLFARQRGKVRWVRLGDLNLYDETDEAQPVTHEIDQLIAHPGYKSTANYDDIALLKLKSDVVFNAYVRPACLNTFRSTPKGQIATATGWGVVLWTNDQGSEDLMKVDLRYDTAQRCNNTFQSLIRTTKTLLRGIIDDTMVCAGDTQGKKDTCTGDSGGPLQTILKHPYYCMYSIVGLTSFGSTACGESNSPAVYTRVSHYVPWITGHVWPN